MRCASCGRELRPAGECPECGDSPGEALRPGDRIAGRYEILGRLGSGGMGAVFRARDLTLEEVVALKVLRGARGPEAVARLRSEIKLAWRVRHRYVCGVREYGEDGDVAYITMELVEGRDLRRLLREQGPPPWEDAYEVVRQIAAGLDAIHSAGVIHRDLKASNVMRDVRGDVRLLDFGIAGAAGARAGEEIVGSPEYMSPEQVRGEEVGPRSDLYSLGILTFEIFTGRLPFRGDTPAATMLLQVEASPPLDTPSVSRLPADLVPILKRMLAKEPADRPRSALEVGEAFAAARNRLQDHGTATFTLDPSGAESSELPAEAALLVPSLLRALGADDPEVRAAAAAALGRVGPPARPAVPGLLAALADPSAAVRRAAETAIAALAPEERLDD